MLPYTRRDFAKLTLAALPAAGALSLLTSVRAAEPRSKAGGGKPNSKVNGVQIGLNVPYSFANPIMTGDEILQRCIELGLSAVELRTQPIEAFLGVPSNLIGPKGTVAVGPAAAANAQKLRQWRTSIAPEGAKPFRRKFEDAGVRPEILKVDGIFKMADDEVDYVFALAKVMGARALSTEISKNEDDLKRLGQFADKHAMMIGYHGHATTTPEHWEKAFTFAKHNAANVDLGHFVAGNNASPVPFIKQHHARITHVHVKDRKRENGPNTPFGEGDTPIIEVLRLIRDNKWNIQATIEFEYKVPAGSDRMKELARTIQYCRDALA